MTAQIPFTKATISMVAFVVDAIEWLQNDAEAQERFYDWYIKNRSSDPEQVTKLSEFDRIRLRTNHTAAIESTDKTAKAILQLWPDEVLAITDAISAQQHPGHVHVISPDQLPPGMLEEIQEHLRRQMEEEEGE